MPMWYNDNPKIIENQLLDAMGGSAAKSAASTSIPLQGDVSSELCPPCEDESVGTPVAKTRYMERPGLQLSDPSVHYHQILPDVSAITLTSIVEKTPKPKGHVSFSTIEVVHQGGPLVERLASSPWFNQNVPVRFHELPETDADPTREYNAIFEIETRMMLAKANRQSLVIWAGNPAKPELDGFAGFLGMLPFRGISVALVTFSSQYPDPFRYATPSGVLEHDSYDAGRMGLSPVKAVFGSLSPRTFRAELRPWDPIYIEPRASDPMLKLPFRIAGLSLPMITYNGQYSDGIAELAERIVSYYAARSPTGERQAACFPVISCGQTVDALGYGADLLAALTERGCAGFYFTHRSGETYKRYSEYAPAELLGQIACAKRAGKTVVFVAVGGGCNGNATGVVAAMTNSHFIEMPTTPLHFNDATTSAKKAFSLIVDDKILSKNLLGTFYLPRLVFCINECFFTCNTASIHSAVGESTKTMNMIGVAPSRAGQRDYHNILGANEFASDTTAIISTVCGFERLVEFILDQATRGAKQVAFEAGARVKALRGELAAAAASGAPALTLESLRRRFDAASSERHACVGAIRERYYAMPSASRAAISEFLTVINAEIVKAKAMFLAYEDPFEKYRALLFEYAHTLGHAVEAWLAGLHLRAEAAGIDSEAAVRNHGQCVGMAVVWAGEMSRRLGALTGDGFMCHQAMVYLFNSFGGFSFGPVRELADKLGVSKAQFLEEVLGGVRLDNKRGYVECADCTKSVDQLVTRRPGQMLRSDDANAEVRYLVPVEESWQQAVLESAFDLEFDNVAHLDRASGKLTFAPLATSPRSPDTSADVAMALRSRIYALYSDDESAACTPSGSATPAELASTTPAEESSSPMRRVQSESARMYSFSSASAAFGGEGEGANALYEKRATSRSAAAKAPRGRQGVEHNSSTTETDSSTETDEPAAVRRRAQCSTPEVATTPTTEQVTKADKERGGMRRASSEAVALDTLHKTRYRAAPSRADVAAMADFSAALPKEYRDQNRLWRQGKTSTTPKRDFDKPPSHAVTLVYREDGLRATWELQLMGKQRPRRAQRHSYESGYATWNMDGTMP